MKIAFATIGDTRDIQRGSGTPYYLWQELLRQGNIVHLVGPLNVKIPFLTRVFKSMSVKIGKRYASYRDPFMGNAIGKKVSQVLAQIDYDVLLTNDYCIAGYTQTQKPVILYTDAFFPYHYAENTHPWLENLSNASVHFYKATTKKGLRRADKCIFASQYVMEEAKKYPSSNKRHFLVIPYGANLESPAEIPNRDMQSIRDKGKIDLLFVGKYWELKGGPIAVRVAEILNEHSINTELHVVGVDESAQYPQEFVKFYGLLNKDNPVEKAKIEELYKTCDVLVVPSKAEGYGLVFVEAAAYGMPSLAYKSTGVLTSVREGESGVLFEVAEDETAFAKQIERWLMNPKEYESLCCSARAFYETSANWDIVVLHLNTEIKILIGEKENAKQK